MNVNYIIVDVDSNRIKENPDGGYFFPKIKAASEMQTLLNQTEIGTWKIGRVKIP